MNEVRQKSMGSMGSERGSAEKYEKYRCCQMPRGIILLSHDSRSIDLGRFMWKHVGSFISVCLGSGDHQSIVGRSVPISKYTSTSALTQRREG